MDIFCKIVIFCLRFVFRKTGTEHCKREMCRHDVAITTAQCAPQLNIQVSRARTRQSISYVLLRRLFNINIALILFVTHAFQAETTIFTIKIVFVSKHLE